ncbi:MAG: phosphatidylserine decarboxylase family protein [Acidobacteriota bacterium]|nr:phosphatidylserine decarboxylase family protein [Acidobacteriota bacterium]
MKIDRAGWPFIGGAFALALVVGGWAGGGWSLPFLLLTVLFLFFFRDPERHVPDRSGIVVSPADGRVLVAGAPEPGVAPPGEWQQVSIFLSPLDVHVNRLPVGGRITRVDFRPGRALPAYRPKAADVNERSEVWIDHDGQAVVARQIVGILARRVVCRAHEGDVVRTGDRFGVMKFGSRMDVFLPPAARLEVTVGQMVRGGETVIATL